MGFYETLSTKQSLATPTSLAILLRDLQEGQDIPQKTGARIGAGICIRALQDFRLPR
jgi:hypothetical protein